MRKLPRQRLLCGPPSPLPVDTASSGHTTTAVSGLDAAGFRQDLAARLSAIHVSAASFRPFTPEGNLHCILPHAQFYSLETNGISLVTWVQALAAGVGVPNVQCPSCQVELSAP